MNRTDQLFTPDRVGALLEELLAKARELRERCGYSETRMVFQPVAIVLRRDGQAAVMPTPFRDNADKQMKMALVTSLAATLQSPLVVLVQDIRYVDPEAFSAAYGLPHPKNDADAFLKGYSEIIDRVGGSLGDCQPGTWHDALMVISKGPVLPLQARMLQYEPGEEDTVRWTEETKILDDQGGNVLELPMLQDWWTPPPARPQ